MKTRACAPHKARVRPEATTRRDTEALLGLPWLCQTSGPGVGSRAVNRASRQRAMPARGLLVTRAASARRGTRPGHESRQRRPAGAVGGRVCIRRFCAVDSEIESRWPFPRVHGHSPAAVHTVSRRRLLAMLCRRLSHWSGSGVSESGLSAASDRTRSMPTPSTGGLR